MPAFLSVSRRVSAMISAIASSTTLRVLENGALKTATPRSEAAAQVDLVGADAERADREQVRGAPSSTAAVTSVFDRMPSSCTPGRRAISSSSSSAPADGLDVVAVLLQPGDRVGVDVLQQQRALGRR